MKRLSYKLLWLLLFPCIKAFSLYNGNPSFPMMPENGLFTGKNAWFGIKVGYEWDDVFDRNLRVKNHHDEIRRKVRKYEGIGNFGTLTLGLADRVEVYTTLGAVSARIHQQPLSHVPITYRSDNQFAWSVGGRGILAYWGDLQLGVNAAYFRYSPKVDSLHVKSASIPHSEAGFHYCEWQVGLSVCYRIGLLYPYIGFKYANVRAKFYHLNAIADIIPEKHFTLENKYPIGLLFGCGLAPEKGFAINAEIRLVDETAVTLSGDLRF